jgi:hypothetical protein
MLKGVVNTNDDWEGKYLGFKYTGKLKPTATTYTWTVEVLKYQDPIGKVRWWGPWHQYTFSPDPNTLFDHSCLTEIAEFCVMQTKKFRNTWAPRGEQKRKPVLVEVTKS